MQEKKINMKRLAAEIGVSCSCISHWKENEKEGSLPNGATLVLLCEFFNVSSDWLLGLSSFRKRR